MSARAALRPARGARAGRALSLLGGVGAVLVPKCPLCFAASAAAISAIGLDAAATWLAVLRAGLIAVTALSVLLVGALSWRRRDPVPPLVAVVGALALGAGMVGGLGLIPELAGASAIVVAAWLNARRCARGAAAC